VKNIILLVLLIPVSVNAIEWMGKEFDEARLFVFNFEKSKWPLDNLIVEGRLNKKFSKDNALLLNEKDIEVVGKATSVQPYETPVGLCYRPRHGIVFYKKNRVEAWVEWCFECKVIRGSPEISNVFSIDWGALASLVSAKKMPITVENMTPEAYNSTFKKEIRFVEEKQKE